MRTYLIIIMSFFMTISLASYASETDSIPVKKSYQTRELELNNILKKNSEGKSLVRSLFSNVKISNIREARRAVKEYVTDRIIEKEKKPTAIRIFFYSFPGAISVALNNKNYAMSLLFPYFFILFAIVVVYSGSKAFLIPPKLEDPFQNN